MSTPIGGATSPANLLALIGLNLIPLIGVVAWGWQTFDLIFLYWMENLVIGAFTLARLIVRPYGHALDLVFPVFLAPFFALHYGGFCWGHGSFVMGLFRPDNAPSGELFATVMTVLSSDGMLLALAGLTLLQMLDWIRDIQRHGFGADSAVTLMVHPYRRIVVLHLTIILGGFALVAMDEPMIGLMVLVVVKTCSDVWHWRRESEQVGEAEPLELTPEMIAEMAEQYPRPVVKVNGKDREFDSFAEMKSSREFRLAMAVMRMIGASTEVRVLRNFLDLKIAEEQEAAASSG